MDDVKGLVLKDEIENVGKGFEETSGIPRDMCKDHKSVLFKPQR